MRTVYLRNVPDDVVERLERLAARDATSVGAAAVRELAEVSRRRARLAPSWADNSCTYRTWLIPRSPVAGRDVPTEDAQALRARAAARNMTLSSYLRELIHDDASRPSASDVLARIAARDHIEASGEDIRSFIDEGRR